MATIAEFDENRYISLVTFRKTGAEVATPVWFAATGDKLCAFTAGAAGKVKRLRNSSRARYATCTMRGTVTGPYRDTAARLVTEREAIARIEKALASKYGWQVWIGNVLASVTGRKAQRAYIEIDF